MSQTLSVVILAKSDQKVESILKNLPTFDELIIVVDRDKDPIEKKVGESALKNIKYYSHPLNNDFSAQRNFALGKATKDLIFFLDADERVSDQLFTEIDFLKTQSQVSDGYLISRVDIFFGKILKYGETGSLCLLRLAKRNSGIWKGRVHETWEIKGKIEKLKGVIIHESHNSVDSFMGKIEYYSSLRAQELFDNKTKFSLFSLIVYPLAKFFLNYFYRRGFLDSERGIILAIGMSFHSFLTRGKLWQLWHEE